MLVWFYPCLIVLFLHWCLMQSSSSLSLPLSTNFFLGTLLFLFLPLILFETYFSLSCNSFLNISDVKTCTTGLILCLTDFVGLLTLGVLLADLSKNELLSNSSKLFLFLELFGVNCFLLAGDVDIF